MSVKGLPIPGRAVTARTLLFVPGDRPERFAKAAGAGPDLIVIDLEDAVALGKKPIALRNVVAWAAETTEPYAVRINAAGTPWHTDEVRELAQLPEGPHPTTVMVPKSEDPGVLAEIAGRLGAEAQLIALIETSLGIHRAVDLARVPGVARLALGSYDLGAELNVDPDHRPAMVMARSALVLASAVAKLEGPIDGVTGAVDDIEQLIGDVRQAKSVGFAGKLCIHPAQVAPTHEALAPTEAELRWATDVLAAAQEAREAGSAAVLVAGRMVDAPVVDRAQRMTDRHTEGAS